MREVGNQVNDSAAYASQPCTALAPYMHPWSLRNAIICLVFFLDHLEISIQVVVGIDIRRVFAVLHLADRPQTLLLPSPAERRCDAGTEERCGGRVDTDLR
jgi:hypothetical protein